MQYEIKQFAPVLPNLGSDLLNTYLYSQQMREAQAVKAQAEAVARAKAEAEAADRAMVANAFEMAHKDPTPENKMRVVGLVAQRNPEQAKAMQAAFSAYDTEKQQTILRDSVRIATALETDPENFGIPLLEEFATAAENAGDAGEAKAYRDKIAQIKSGPRGLQAVKDGFTLVIGSIPGGDKAFEGMAKVGKETRERAAEPTVQRQRLADAGLTEARINEVMANTRNLDAKTQEALIDFEVKKAGGLYTPEDAAKAENELRQELTKKQSYFQAVKNAYDVIANADTTSIGDVALISTYMRLLDPNSAVRESEFATAENAGGVPSSVRALYNKVLGTGKLDTKVRDEIMSQSKKVFSKAQEQAKKDEDFYKRIAERRGLNVKNIIDSEQSAVVAPSTGMSPTANVQGAPADVGKAVPGTSATVKQPVVTGDF